MNMANTDSLLQYQIWIYTLHFTLICPIYSEFKLPHSHACERSIKRQQYVQL